VSKPIDATGSIVWHTYQTAEHEPATEADHARAVEILAWVRTLDASEMDERTGEPSYLASLAYSCRGTVSLFASCIAASAVQAYEREQARRVADGAWTNGYAGKPDDKVVLDLVVRRSLGWALACADTKGRQVIVKQRLYKTDGERVEVGDSIRVSAIVNRCSIFRDVDQTLLKTAAVYRPTETLPGPVQKRAREQAEREGTETPAWAVAASKASRRHTAQV
jgi:hypothetical protein